MQINEINWLHNKKEDLLKELIDLQLKSHTRFLQHDQTRVELQKNLKQKQELLKEVKRTSSNEIILMQRKVDKLEQLIVKNEKQIEKVTSENEELQQKNSNLQNQVKQLSFKLQSRQKQLQSIRQQASIKLSQQQMIFTRQFQRQQQKLTQIVAKYEGLLQEKQQHYKSKYDKDLHQLRIQNQAVIRKLEEKYSVKENGQKQDQKKFQKQCIRLVEENKRILEELSNSKTRLLTAESSLSTERQQTKLKLKEQELKLQHSRKELELVKEAETRLASKNKWYLEQNEELQWQIKQLEMNMAQQIKKLKKHSNRQLSQIIDKSQKQVDSIKAQLNIVKNNELQPLLQENANLKRATDLLNREKLELEKHCHQHQLQIKQLNQQFSSVIQTTKENQHLKQNNLKKCQEIEVLQEQIKRLKQKCNKLSTVYQEMLKHREIMEKQNKMLLEEIIFLRDKQNKHKNNQNRNNTSFSQPQNQENLETQNRQYTIMDQSSNVLQMKSEMSQDYEDVNEYKQVIKELDKGMQDALHKINQKDKVIQKQQSMIAKMQRIIAYGK